MAVNPAPNPRLIADAESDRSTSWAEGTEVYCKDTGKTYRLISGAFVLSGMSPDAIAAAITSGDIPIVLNGKQLTIAANGTVSSADPA